MNLPPVSADDPRLQAFAQLVAVVARLRDPQTGCPWDLAQTHESLVPYAIEEAYEVAAAIRSGETNAIAEELGDLLLQVVLHAQIAGESERFDLAQVARGISEKLVRRHPHVFGAAEIANVEDVRRNWDAIKAAEKGESTAEAQRLSRKLARYATSLPPLLASLKISRKAVEVGFEWEDAAGVWEKFSEELGEFKEALEIGDRAHQEAELGDLLFTIVNIARWHGLDPDAALQGTNQRFAQRLRGMENLTERPLAEHSLAELEALWQRAKQQIRAAKAAAAAAPNPSAETPPPVPPPKSADAP
ncbi:MAG: nucleoside triphosphate pyrophosphohydrolase [Cyanobacteria bacterium J06641_5]